MIDDLHDHLEKAMIEDENLRREAFEESMRCRKAVKQAVEAIQKVSLYKNLSLLTVPCI